MQHFQPLKGFTCAYGEIQPSQEASSFLCEKFLFDDPVLTESEVYLGHFVAAVIIKNPDVKSYYTERASHWLFKIGLIFLYHL